jgi:hopanoid biosynthesis associated RND transporter like protein HpnN
MLSTFAQSLVRASRRRSWLTTLLILAIAVGAAAAAVRTLGMNTDSEALFEPGLPFRVAQAAFDAQFPSEVDLIVAVIDGPSALEAQRAADKLTEALAPRRDLFHDVQNPTGGAFFKKNGLLYLSADELDQLSGQLAQAQPFLGAIATDRSARGMFRLFDLAFNAAAKGEAGTEAIAPAVLQASDVIAEVLDGKPATLNWGSLFTGIAPAEQPVRAMVLVQPQLNLAALEQGGDSSAFIREQARRLGLTQENGYRVRLTGQIPLSDEEFATIAEGMGISGAVSIVLVGILLFMALGSWRVVTATLVTLVAGLLLTLGWAALAIGELNLISVAFAVMFVGIAVDFGIQFCMRYRAERHARGAGAHSLDDSLDAAGRAMASPLVLAAATTSLGFFSFLPTNYRGVSQLGVIAGGGMIIAVILSFTLLPALLRVLRARSEQGEVGYSWAAPVNRAIVSRRRPVLAAAALLALLSLAALPKLTFDFDPLKLKDPRTESMSTALELMDDPLINPNTLNALVPTAGEAKALAAKLGALPEVSHALTIFDVIPDDQDIKLAALEDLSFLMGPVLQPGEARPAPTTEDIFAAARNARDHAQAYLAARNEPGPLHDAATQLVAVIDRLLATNDSTLPEKLSAALLTGFDDAMEPLMAGLSAEHVSLETLPESLRAAFIAHDGRYRVQAFPKIQGGDITNLTQFLKAVQTIAPDVIGSPVVIYETGRLVTSAFRTAAILALIAITLLLFAVLHRVGDVLHVLAPLLLAGVLTLGTCALIDFPLNFANIIALPLLLGVGVTFPIYFVSAWREGEGALLASPAGRGMLYSAMTTAAAFGSLAISTHTGTASMGILLTMALAYTLLATLIVLPALLGPAPASRKFDLA